MFISILRMIISDIRVGQFLPKSGKTHNSKSKSSYDLSLLPPSLALHFCCYDYEVVNPPCFLSSSVATETENSNDMNVENNNTAETVSEQTDHGNNIVTIQTTLGDEGKDSLRAKTVIYFYCHICRPTPIDSIYLAAS